MPPLQSDTSRLHLLEGNLCRYCHHGWKERCTSASSSKDEGGMEMMSRYIQPPKTCFYVVYQARLPGPWVSIVGVLGSLPRLHHPLSHTRWGWDPTQWNILWAIEFGAHWWCWLPGYSLKIVQTRRFYYYCTAPAKLFYLFREISGFCCCNPAIVTLDPHCLKNTVIARIDDKFAKAGQPVQS